MRRFVLNATCLLLCMCQALVASAQERTADEYFKQGNAYYQDAAFALAVKSYQLSVEQKGDFKEAWYNLGIAYSRIPNHEEEIRAYEKALEIDKAYTKALYNLAMAYEDNGRTDKAIDAYKRVLAAEPNAVDAHVNVGILYAQTGRFTEARTAYMEALRLDPEMADASFNLGIVLGKQAEAQEGDEKKKTLLAQVETYKRAIATRPHYHKAWYNVAMAYEKLGETAQEIEAYQEALRLKKDDYPQALFNLARAQESTGDTQSAMVTWSRYLEVARKKVYRAAEREFVKTAEEQLARLKGSAPPEDAEPTTP
jgi:tetratricopeptide (TPR) repeat protein